MSSARTSVESEIGAVFPRLWRYCRVVCGTHDGADDLAQATVVRAIERAELFSSGGRFDLWLFRIAQRLWVDELRAQRVRRGAGVVSVDEIELPDPRPSGETAVFNQEVLRSVMQLPEAQRMAVMLVYVDGYRYREAAEILEIPIGTVMSRLAAARARLASALTASGKRKA